MPNRHAGAMCDSPRPVLPRLSESIDWKVWQLAASVVENGPIWIILAMVSIVLI